MMRVHHLNCGTLRPFGRRAINGDGLPLVPGRLVCHCLLLEAERRLVLVDSGFGLDDVSEGRRSLVSAVFPSADAQRATRISRRMSRARSLYTRFMTRASFDPDETAVRQVAALGYSPHDVTDIVITHLDLDHAGGLRDFPAARVHVHETEYSAAMSASTSIERFRYWRHQWSHRPDWVTYGSSGGDAWFGFDGVHQLEELPDLALVPLPGHTRGHCGVAVRLQRADGGSAGRTTWLLHGGDAYFFRGEIDPVEPHCTPGLARFQARFEVDREARRGNRERLRQLAAEHGNQVVVFCSHDPVEFDRLRNRGPAGTEVATAMGSPASTSWETRR